MFNLSVILNPKLFATIIEKAPITGNINIKPSLFATIIEHTPATGNVITKPFLFATIKTKDFFNGDTLREITGEDETIFNGDTLRRLCEKFSGDTLRVIKNYEIFSGDTCRELREVFSGDTERKIVKTEKFSGDTIIRTPYILKYLIEESQVMRSAAPTKLKSVKKAVERPVSLMNTLKDFGITSLTLNLNAQALSDTLSLESATHMDINTALKGQLFNYKFNFLVDSTSHKELIQTINGMYDKDEILYTQIKLDSYELSQTLTDYEMYCIRQCVPAVNMLYKTVKDDGKIFISSEADPKTGQTTEKYAQYYAPDMHIMDKEEAIRYLTVQHWLYSANYIVFVAKALNLKTYIKIRDFHNTQLKNYLDNYITYMELLQNAYSWSSSIPQRQINVFIRDDTLYVIERGLEDDVFDITDLPHSIPTIDRKLIWTTWEKQIVKVTYKKSAEDLTDPEPNPDTEDDDEEEDDDDEEEEDDDDNDDDDDDDEPTPFTGTINYSILGNLGQVSITYGQGLMDHNYKSITTINEDGETVTTKEDTTYTYDYYMPENPGTPSFGSKKKNNKKNNQKATVYTNKKEFEKAMKQWQKQKTKAETQYQKQLQKQEQQRRKALAALQKQYKPIWYLESENSTISTISETYKSETENIKINYYDGIGDSTYIFEERELTKITEYTRGSSNASWDKGDETKNTRQTFHEPIGNGYYANTVYENGEFKAASLSQGKPFQQVTLFTSNQIQKSWNKSNSSGGEEEGGIEPPEIPPQPEFKPERENNQNPDPAGNNNNNNDKPKKYTYTTEVNIDSSFPTNDKNVAKELEEALEWLNRKIQENVTIEIYGAVINGIPEVQHIVDFTERVKFGENEYFLGSNTIKLTPNSLSQRLKLVRWY